ncbi:Holliday junction branch migration protein RuvA [Persicirhabdus sediminis]|uniref:Holliday junction branch migration complex subunit RuvA n=1 Tax=Persicirhabdus sediminis TaxID=454144 RepID=A0A8J7SJZ2_9BACT|nr:Holliday junction branch migration protein RuvA [Persicirhabdus sediminis]MBK1790465.1 Holliday junction branch migration protein RuvA [Persicirhabdus sediminis]
MIARLRGKVWEALPNRLVIDVNGVGYLVNVPLSTFDKLNPLEGAEVSLHIHTHIREQAHSLFGFATQEERDVFLLLIDRVSGIGPSIAMSVLSGMSVEHFKQAVVNGDANSLTSIKGLGKKTAERIILELKDKVGVTESWEAAASELTPSAIVDAEYGLIALGYKQSEARKAVKAAQAASPSAESGELLRQALRVLN